MKSYLNKIADAIIREWNKEDYPYKKPQHFICESSGKPYFSEDNKKLALSMGAKETDFPILCLLLSNRIKRGMRNK